ncbi:MULTISPECIES: helix-turn-helix domain-containing protein [unclassified Devosia]|uniref:helix-turn-helix domain-containing protein n=1 Tax=unclassified Devosia TaxID=196773 RepID=UPI00086AF294|nr:MULTISPECIES: helix-turn-helix domain-containing protein [unclassified Devosia]MBN9364996.1 helix-turn-helix domain-containing protein [Devosia sp.]ODS95596.1 MAG: DNA-binding protein [Devosia sp. SCN 66-27]OJX21158.1 MAG: DNA-binding protein [Devosia sp. 66-14]
MDSLITAAARALGAGDPLGALKRVALREDAPALALRGIAMAQLGDLERAKALLKAAGRAFQPREAVARARCVVAEAEIALVSRDLSWQPEALAAAQRVLEAQGDRTNAAHAANLAARRLLLIGQVDEAERILAQPDLRQLPPASVAVHQLVTAGVAVRRVQSAPARAAFERSLAAARQAGIHSLLAEIEADIRVLNEPAARLLEGGGERSLTLAGVEAVLGSAALVIDATRNVARQAGTVVQLGTRPVLFALLRTLATAWPRDVSRAQLIAEAFRGKEADESHRARLRVEMGRLRSELAGLAEINATMAGFTLAPLDAHQVAVLAPPVEDQHAGVLALLADGEAWASSALAIALGTSPRTVQRALEQLAAAGKVQSFGRGRALRWITPPVPGFPTALLLPGPLPGD